MDNKIFKTYDIRGVYPDELDKKTAYLVGRAYPFFLQEKSPTIALAMDGRESSPELFKETKKGIIDSGGEVYDIGLATTPLLNFSVCKYNLSGGIMITASHNPPNFNGFKLIKEKGLQVYGKEIMEIKRIINKKEYQDKKGKSIKKEPLEDYLDHIISFGENIDNMKVVVDYGNGVGSYTGKPAFEKLNCETISLFDEIDGTFPNHLPNPHEVDNMKKLMDKVKKEKADLGVFFDGDGDRAFIIDEKGEVVYPDLLVALLAKKELKENPGEEIYFDLRFSKITSEIISKYDGIPRMMRVGNPFYKEKLIKEGGLMGAELSGHIMHKDNFSIDDGLFIAVKVIDFLSQKKKSLSQLIKPLKKYHQSPEINMEVSDKEEALEAAKKEFPDGVNYDLDGVYIEFEDWWFNLRKSNTEDLVRLRLEANTKEKLAEKKELLVSLIKRC